MRNPFETQGFERRLLFFLLLSVTPTVLIAIFGARYLIEPVERVSSPAVRESFSNAVGIARQLASRLEVDAHLASTHLSEAYEKKSRRNLKGSIGQAAERNGTDFGALYVRQDTIWTLVFSEPPTGGRLDTTIPASQLSDEPIPQTIQFEDPDMVAAGILKGADSLLVTGFALEPGTVQRMRQTSDDLGRYSSVRAYVSMLRIYMVVLLAFLAVITAVASTVASRLLARRISHPIRELARATERVAKGDLSHRVDVKARDEIRSLISSFNNMTEELEENKRNLIEMARREAQVTRDYEIARQVQQDLFPKTLPDKAGWDFAATCRPARAVGGDYYDIFEFAPGKVLFAQGDVSGKGLGASLLMASVHAVVRSWAGAVRGDPSRLIDELNQYLIDASSVGTFVTLFLGVVDCDSGRVWYVNCGHPPALLLRTASPPTNGAPEELSTGGPVLGVVAGDHYKAGETRMVGDDKIVLVSDGVTEATNPEDDMFDIKGLVDVLSASGDRGAQATMDGVIDATYDFMKGREQSDDISVLVVRRGT
jgi:serine phosphatase RsbU (regulator of sigma subunit)